MVGVIDNYLSDESLSKLMNQLKAALPLFRVQGRMTMLRLTDSNPWCTELDALLTPAIAQIRLHIPEARTVPMTITRSENRVGTPYSIKYLLMRKQAGSFPLHQDGLRKEFCYWPRQFVTILLYLQYEPIKGGNFICYEGDEKKVIEPLHNRLVWFNSELPHEAEEVSCEASVLSGRFTLRAFL